MLSRAFPARLFFRIKNRKRFADDLIGTVPFDSFRSRVPTDDDAFRVQLEQCHFPDRVRKLAKEVFIGVQRLLGAFANHPIAADKAESEEGKRDGE